MNRSCPHLMDPNVEVKIHASRSKPIPFQFSMLFLGMSMANKKALRVGLILVMFVVSFGCRGDNDGNYLEDSYKILLKQYLECEMFMDDFTKSVEKMKTEKDERKKLNFLKSCYARRNELFLSLLSSIVAINQRVKNSGGNLAVQEKAVIRKYEPLVKLEVHKINVLAAAVDSALQDFGIDKYDRELKQYEAELDKSMKPLSARTLRQPVPEP